jgi:hypothetical protein
LGTLVSIEGEVDSFSREMPHPSRITFTPQSFKAPGRLEKIIPEGVNELKYSKHNQEKFLTSE